MSPLFECSLFESSLYLDGYCINWGLSPIWTNCSNVRLLTLDLSKSMKGYDISLRNKFLIEKIISDGNVILRTSFDNKTLKDRIQI